LSRNPFEPNQFPSQYPFGNQTPISTGFLFTLGKHGRNIAAGSEIPTPFIQEVCPSVYRWFPPDFLNHQGRIRYPLGN